MLRDLFGDRNPAEIADHLELPIDIVTGLLSDTIRVNDQIASRLAAATGTKPRVWLNVQAAAL
jgi:plasmid maintenance system antidote protein VapI